MLISIPEVLNGSAAADMRAELERASWADGRNSAGYLSSRVKHNEQLADGDPTARRLGEIILTALDKVPRFTAAALPRKVLPPLFNRYRDGAAYGGHIDGAVRPLAGTSLRVRTDISATLFLSPTDSYDGGELMIRDSFGEHEVKLPAGHMVLYPGTSVHRVEPVTRGTRYAAFFWIQSMVRSDMHRSILFDLDNAIQRLATDVPAHDALVELAGVYHNLLREWADV